MGTRHRFGVILNGGQGVIQLPEPASVREPGFRGRNDPVTIYTM